MTWVFASGVRIDLGQIVVARFFFLPIFCGGFGFLHLTEVLHWGTLPHLLNWRTPRAGCVAGEILLLLKSLTPLIYLTY